MCLFNGAGISDHDLIYVSFKLFRPKLPPKLIASRNYKNVNTVEAKNDLESVPWHITEVFEDVHDSLWCWEYLFKDIISKHVKTRKVKVRRDNLPWMYGEIRKALNNRFKLLKRARNSPCGSK